MDTCVYQPDRALGLGRKIGYESDLMYLDSTMSKNSKTMSRQQKVGLCIETTPAKSMDLIQLLHPGITIYISP